MSELGSFSRRALLFAFVSGALACRRRQNLPELGTLSSFSLINQAGQTVSAETLKGSVWVAAFMFTRCPTICPRITAQMKKIQHEAKQRGVALRLVSFSVDPEYDTPPILTAYAKQYAVDLANWSFLTGNFETVKRTAVDGFKLALEGSADAGGEHYGIVHGSHLILVDQALKIRGYYRSSDDEEMNKLLSDAAQLSG